MKVHPLIYRRGPEYILLDPSREIRIGTYDEYDQAMRAWTIYWGTSRQSTGFDYEGYDEYVTDMFMRDTSTFLTSKAEILK